MPLSILYCTSEFYGPCAVAFVTARFPPAFPSAVFVVIAVGSSRAIPVLIPWCLRILRATPGHEPSRRTDGPWIRAPRRWLSPQKFPDNQCPFWRPAPPAVNSFVQFARRVLARAASWATIMSVKGEYVGSPATPYGYFCLSTAATAAVTHQKPGAWSWTDAFLRRRLRTGEKGVSEVLQGTSETPLCDAVTFQWSLSRIRGCPPEGPVSM